MGDRVLLYVKYHQLSNCQMRADQAQYTMRAESPSIQPRYKYVDIFKDIQKLRFCDIQKISRCLGKNCDIQNFCFEKRTEIMLLFFFQESSAVLIRTWASVTEIQTNLHIWACRNQIQQYFPFIMYVMWHGVMTYPLSHAQTEQQCPILDCF